MMKDQTGVMRTLPKKDLVDFNVNMTIERLLQNRIDPSTIKTPGQLDNIIKQIEAPRNVQTGIKNTKSAKIFDMEGKEIPKDAKIMGGKQAETEAEIAARMNKENKEAAQRFKEKQKEAMDDMKDIEDPEDMADGGVAGMLGERPGYKLGDIVKKNIPEEYRLYLKSILPGGEEGKVDESYFTEKFKKELRSQALDKFLRTGKTRGIVTEGDQHRGDPTINKLLKFPSTYAALGTYTYDIDPKTMNVKITDKYDFNPAYGSKTIGDKTYTGYVGDKEGTDVGLGMFKDKFKDSHFGSNESGVGYDLFQSELKSVIAGIKTLEKKEEEVIEASRQSSTETGAFGEPIESGAESGDQGVNR